jgi:hypothetical protein
MALITTIKGELDESLLDFKSGRQEDDNEIATWQEWWFNGELVKRDAQVQLKKWPEGMSGIGKFN